MAAAASSNPAFADAVQRARQITAKIGGSEKIAQKRPMEDGPGATDPAKRAAVQDPYGAQLAAMKNPSHGPMAGNLGAVVSEEIRVPDKMVGLIIGRGGEQITRLQVESGAKIQMAPDSNGLPDRLCTLTGSQEAISLGKTLIENIINSKAQTNGNSMMGASMMGGLGPKLGMGGPPQGHSIELLVPSSKVGLVIGKGGETIRNLSDKHGVKMVIVQDSPSQEGDKPLRIVGDPMRCEQAKDEVLEILNSAPFDFQPPFDGPPGMGRGRGRPPFGDFGSPPGGPMPGGNQLELPVPQPAVGVIIGKGGEMIKKIQSDSGARLQFQQGKTMSPGEQVLLVSGKPDQVQEARRMVIELIESVMARDDAMGRGRGRGRGRPFGGPPNWNGPPGDSNWSGPPGDGPGNITEILYAVPANKCGLVIGKGGENIKQINSQSGAHCELDKRPPTNPNEKLFYIRGTPDQIEHAKQLIGEKIGGMPGHMSGPSHGPGGSQFSQNMHGGRSPPHSSFPPQGWNSSYQPWQSGPQPTTASSNESGPAQPSGHADFSQQWIEYYKQMGEHDKAAAIEQSLKARQQQQQQQQHSASLDSMHSSLSSGGPGAASSQESTGKADYTAQWIAYYRANGMIKEAEAIEQNLKARSGAAASPYGSSGGGAQSYYQNQSYPGYPG